MQRLVLIIVMATVAPGAAAQIMSAEITPDTAGPGVPITVTITPNQSVNLPSACAFTAVRDDINGNVVTSFFCAAIIVPLSPCQPHTQTWSQMDDFGNQVPPGTYWFEVRYFDPAGTLRTEWFCCRVEPAGATPPTLTANGPLQIGMTTTYDVDAPAAPGGFYIMLASLTTNTGILFGNDRLCLDDDFVLQSTFPAPNPAAFTNFQGFLDASGHASGIGITMPNLPGLACVPFHTQALVFDFLTNTLRATNGVSQAIQ